MAEKDTIYSTKIKYRGYFGFKDLYNFCYEWLSEESGLEVEELEYSEKLSGPTKNIDIRWEGSAKVSDYFKFVVKVEFKILAMKDVEIEKDGQRVKTNSADISIKVKGVLVKDYDGKFESSARMKLWRSIYEKWIIPSRVKEYEDKLAGICDEFVGQTKAFLAISGNR